jgi:hypothetical protein
MVCAHYPLIDFTRFMKGYPKEVGMQEAGERGASYLSWRRR